MASLKSSSSSSSPPSTIVIVSRYKPESFQYDEKEEKEDEKISKQTLVPKIQDIDKWNDMYDDFNHPRQRRAMILHELSNCNGGNNVNDDEEHRFVFQIPNSPTKDLLKLYNELGVTSEGLVEFLSTAWDKWDSLGAYGQDPMCSLTAVIGQNNGEDDDDDNNVRLTSKSSSPPLIPGNVALPRDPYQRPSQNVMGQIGYYCTDICTPIFEQLQEELLWDTAVMKHSAKLAVSQKQYGTTTTTSVSTEMAAVYALGTHPGHHAAYDSFGGYCYINHAGFVARLLQQELCSAAHQQENKKEKELEKSSSESAVKVAILDVDYHCGNGTASIFYDDPSVLVISIHCDPDHEYPFHSGYNDDTGAGAGRGTTLHLPLPPGTGWKDGYQGAMDIAIQRLQDFHAQALVVSLGLDTVADDPCSIRRAGFKLSGKDYYDLGQAIGRIGGRVPTVFIQEGGYFMDKVPAAVREVLTGFACQANKRF